jgi:hypothetical protein
MWNWLKKICLLGYEDILDQPVKKRQNVYRIKGKKYVLKKRVTARKSK